jgi:hypothetical protein
VGALNTGFVIDRGHAQWFGERQKLARLVVFREVSMKQVESQRDQPIAERCQRAQLKTVNGGKEMTDRRDVGKGPKSADLSRDPESALVSRVELLRSSSLRPHKYRSRQWLCGAFTTSSRNASARAGASALQLVP